MVAFLWDNAIFPGESMAAAYIQDKTEFNALLETELVFVVDCTATWCGPCKMIAPIIEELETEMKDIKFVKLDVDENPQVEFVKTENAETSEQGRKRGRQEDSEKFIDQQIIQSKMDERKFKQIPPKYIPTINHIPIAEPKI